MQLYSNYSNNSMNQNNSLSFKSKFLRTKTLRKAFEEIKPGIGAELIQDRRQFVNAVKAILNDGKNDVIRLSEEGNNALMYVNGKQYEKGRLFINWDGKSTGTREAIIDFAEKHRDIKKVSGYDSLNKEEVATIQNKLKRFKKISPQSDDFMHKLKCLYTEVTLGIDFYVHNELTNLQKLIFKYKN